MRGVQTAATRWRITGEAILIDVWYLTKGGWIGLDSTLAGGHGLRDRLE
jgi:hypothetical protein